MAGSTCNTTTLGEEFCECLSGTLHDYTFGHFKNCSLSADFYLVFLILSSLGTFSGLIFTAQALPKLEAIPKRIAWVFLLLVICLYLGVVTQFVQGGMYAPGLVLSLFDIPLYWLLASELWLFLIHPVYAFAMRPFDRAKLAVRLAFGVSALLVNTLVCAAIAFASDPGKSSWEVSYSEERLIWMSCPSPSCLR
jgi:hypothetical protein